MGNGGGDWVVERDFTVDFFFFFFGGGCGFFGGNFSLSYLLYKHKLNVCIYVK